MISQHVRRYAHRASSAAIRSTRPPRPAIALNKTANQAIAGRDKTYEGDSKDKAYKPWKLPLVWAAAGTVFTFVLCYQGVLFYNAATRVPAEGSHDVHLDLNAVYEETAGEFDAGTDSTEFWLGISRLRKKLIARANGHVLESGAGTGRNLHYYNSDKVQHLTLVDQSTGMLDIAKEKWENREMKGKGWRSKVNFATMDLAASDGAQSKRKFDTVVQTFALCSTNDPVQLLRNLGEKTTADGQILLLEHGKGHYEFLNKALDNTALAHAKRFGCWWNRDIAAIVEQSGLEIVEAKRFTLGTTWWYVLRPKAVEVDSASDEVVLKEQGDKSSVLNDSKQPIQDDLMNSPVKASGSIWSWFK